jgi:hypothetical protein
MANFQVKLGDTWQDFTKDEDNLLKQHFEMRHGGGKVMLPFRGQHYEFDFEHMTQRNLATGKSRKIRPPRSGKVATRGVASRPAVSMAASKFARDDYGGSWIDGADYPEIILPASAVKVVIPDMILPDPLAKTSHGIGAGYDKIKSSSGTCAPSQRQPSGDKVGSPKAVSDHEFTLDLF